VTGTDRKARDLRKPKKGESAEDEAAGGSGSTSAGSSRSPTTTSAPAARGIYPEQAGLVASLAHPGGNVTGTTVGPVTGGKYLELLKEAFPKLTRVPILLDSTFPGLADAVTQEQVEIEGRKLGLTLTPIAVQRQDDVEQALARVAKERPGALCVAGRRGTSAVSASIPKSEPAARHPW
jgi:putative ABC transport system substrate-binding protein